jgi:hypothetical protein
VSDEQIDTTDPANQAPVIVNTWRPKKWAYVALSASTVATGLLGGLIAVWLTSDSIGPVEWGPVAAWVGGVLTAAAVSVSLWQALKARTEAKQNREDAERRHFEQIDEAKRQRQVATISPIWIAIVESLTPTNTVLNNIERVVLTSTSLQARGTDHQGYEALRARRNAAVQELRESLPAFMNTTYAVELSFSNAMMVVEQPDVVKSVEDLYQAFIELRKAYSEMAQRAVMNQKVDLKMIKELRSRVNMSRDPMVKAVRQHLTKAAPLRKFDT